jgi:DNA (cytosine-5)-methyltransferase 1
MVNKPTYISLFSGAGSGCYGFKQNDYECIATNEVSTRRLNIQKYNKKCKYETGYINADILLEDTKKKIKDEVVFWQKKHKIKEIDVLIATPPCQGMSVANHKKTNEKKRNSLVVESIKITKELEPKFFVFENVRAFLKTICTDIDNTDKSIEETIKINLGGKYNILSKVINFKNYGSGSSRTRTIVIGVKKDIINVTPYDIFPKEKNINTLKDLISDLPSLKTMGEISKDILHSYREFDKRMLPWIENLKEGQSAFDNIDKDRIPHKIVDGKKIYNKRKNGDKYSRWYWNREGPCIHTRNDILASQNTIHPKDNRVFSIRELMRLMSIPENFQWFQNAIEELNLLTKSDKRIFLKKEELNIRHCIGESVPTSIFDRVAKNIKLILKKENLSKAVINKIIEDNNLCNTDNLIAYIEKNNNNLSLENLMRIAELANSKRQSTSAFFTRQDIAYTLLKDIPLINKKKIKIVEPSVGVGNFIPLIIEKYKDKEEVHLELFDIDDNSIKILKVFLEIIKPPKNFKIKIRNLDFLLWDTKTKFDLIIGNPPYGKITKNKALLTEYKTLFKNIDTSNIFSFFIEKSIQLGIYIALIVPKSLLSAQNLIKHEV